MIDGLKSLGAAAASGQARVAAAVADGRPRRLTSTQSGPQLPHLGLRQPMSVRHLVLDLYFRVSCCYLHAVSISSTFLQF